MQKIFSLLILTALSGFVSAQTNYEKFKKLFEENDTTKIKSLLIDWEKTNPNDPELYTSAFNFYFTTSKQDILSLQNEKPKNESYQLTDSTGKVAGYLTSNAGYDPTKLAKAMFYANKGIEKFPDRLDIRFGKCYVLGQLEDYSGFTKTIIEVVDYSLVNKNNWLWTENKKQEDAENFMLATIQEYLRQLYETENDNLLANMIAIGEKTINHYPKNVEILSTTAVALMLTKQYDKAIGYLKQAETLNPKDFIVLNNIARGYQLKGDKTNAVKYYELTEKYGDEDAKQQARERIKELKN